MKLQTLQESSTPRQVRPKLSFTGSFGTCCLALEPFLCFFEPQPQAARFILSVTLSLLGFVGRDAEMGYGLGFSRVARLPVSRALVQCFRIRRKCLYLWSENFSLAPHLCMEPHSPHILLYVYTCVRRPSIWEIQIGKISCTFTMGIGHVLVQRQQPKGIGWTIFLNSK